MKFTPVNPPRIFSVGPKGEIQLKDCARIGLEADEQVTFVTDLAAEYDVVKKSWGFYATPSLNGRLLKFGLHAALIKSPDGKFYVFLIEQDKVVMFQRYCSQENLIVVRWLDSNAKLEELNTLSGSHNLHSVSASPCAFCKGTGSTLLFTYDSPPDGETQFQLPTHQPYRREIIRCNVCGHFMSVHDMNLSKLYAGEYVNSTYGDGGIQEAFERIVGLDPGESDNTGRVNRILEFWKDHVSASRASDNNFSVLDVGSGLCVFLYRMKAAGWKCTALDPDPRAVKHAKEVVGVTAVCSDLMTAEGLSRYDVITFNKVLEHVKDPVRLLGKALEHIEDHGVVYIEVPDGEAAAVDGFGREEFFIEHWHIFTAASVTLLAARAGFEVRALERLREPSSKYTLRAFLVPSRQLVSEERGKS